MKKSSKKKLLIILLFIILLIGTAAAAAILVLLPNNSDIKQYDGKTYKVAANGDVRGDVLFSGGEKYFSYDIIKSYIDKYIWLDGSAGIITITDRNGITRIDEKNSEYILAENGKIFFKESFISEKYKTTFQYNKENNVTVISNEEMYTGYIISLKDELCIRSGPSVKNPRVKVIKNENGKTVAKAFTNNGGNWIKVTADTGETGYVKKSEVKFVENKKYTGIIEGFNTGEPGSAVNNDKTAKSNDFKAKFKTKKINMVWEAVYSQNPDVSKIGEMEGLNVIAPTWFNLSDTNGKIKNTADTGYVKWAHGRGYYVWGTAVSNTDYNLTSSFLKNYEARNKFVNDIINYAVGYNLDGINIDFEYMNEEDKMLFTQFVREISALCHINGLMVSCDVTVLSNNSKWSLCYDRKSLSDSVDHMCVMFYDQYSGSGGKAGSVAQLSWTAASLKNILNQIPNNKLILAIPFYTRLWEEKEQNGATKATSVVFNMRDSQNLIREKGLTPVWDEQSGQYYVQYEYEGAAYKLWVEDEKSIKGRVQLVIQNNLAGCAAWRRNFETENIWKVINNVLTS